MPDPPEGSTGTTERPGVDPRWVLLLGALSIASGAILIRKAEGVDPLVIALWRCGLAALLVLPMALRRGATEAPRLVRSDFIWILLAGLSLAAHFATWIESLSHTSVASSTVLVSTTPIWVGLLAPRFTGDRVGRGMGIGIGVCTLGAVALGLSDRGGVERALYGDGLALAGGIFASLFLLFGRKVRQRTSFPRYLALAYGTAALALVPWVVVGGEPVFDHPPRVLLALVLLTLIPQLLGHSSFQWALRWVSAPLVAVSTVGEPVGATLLAWVLLGERPTLGRALAVVILCAGILIAAGGESTGKPEEAP